MAVTFVAFTATAQTADKQTAEKSKTETVAKSDKKCCGKCGGNTGKCEMGSTSKADNGSTMKNCSGMGMATADAGTKKGACCGKCGGKKADADTQTGQNTEDKKVEEAAK